MLFLEESDDKNLKIYKCRGEVFKKPYIDKTAFKVFLLYWHHFVTAWNSIFGIKIQWNPKTVQEITLALWLYGLDIFTMLAKPDQITTRRLKSFEKKNVVYNEKQENATTNECKKAK